MAFFNIEPTKKEPKKPSYTCKDCGLSELVKSPKMSSTIPYGEGHKKILIISEKPTLNEDKHNDWYCGESGNYLRNTLSEFDIDLTIDCWSTFAVCCHVKEPNNKHINCCRKHWQKLIKELQPEKVLLLGKSAITSFMGDRMSKVGTQVSWLGYSIPDQDYKCWVFPVYHPLQALTDKNEMVDSLFFEQIENAIEHDKLFLKHKEDITCITELDVALDYLTKMTIEQPELLAFDYEGSGLKPERKGHFIRTIGFCFEDNKACAMPIFNDWRFDDLIELILTDSKINKTCHHLGFEQKWTKSIFGYDIKPGFHDSMICSHVLDNRGKISSLKRQAYLRYGVVPYNAKVNHFLTTSKEGEDEKSSNRFNIIEKAPLNELLYYNAQDALFTYRLTKTQLKELKRKRVQKGYKLFHDGVIALSNVSAHGMRIDDEYFENKSLELAQELENTQKTIQASEEHTAWFKSKNKNLDILSSDQVKKLILDVLKLQTNKKTKKGNYSVDSEVLENLAKKNKFFDLILKYRKTQKVKSTYIEGIYRESVNGIVHPNINLHTVATFRSSVSDPNFQNIPKRDKIAQKHVRTGVIPSKGHQLMDVDYGQIEVRMGCPYHKDPNMIKYVTDPNTDMHRDAALKIFMLPKSEIKTKEFKKVRQEVKNKFVFPEFYGDYYGSCAKALWKESLELELSTGEGLSEFLANEKNICCYNEFEEHLKAYEHEFWHKQFKIYTAWKDEYYESYLSKGYIELLTGFRCSHVMDKKQVCNTPIQGTAFHCLLWSLIETEYELREWNSKICMQIHDSMLIDIDPNELEDLKPIIREIMTIDIRKHWDWINVPLDIDAKISEIDGNWANMKEEKI